MYYSWKAHLWNNVYNRWITSNFPFRWHGTTSTTSGWRSSIFNRNSSGERRLKFIASREDDDNKKPRAKHREKRLAQRRQRRQHSDHKQVQKQRQNTTITRQMEPMKRGNTDCRRFKRRWGDQATLTVYSKIIFFDAAIGSNSYTICTSRTGADLGGGCRGYAPPSPPEMTCGFLIQLIFYQKKKLCGLLVLK